MKVAVGSVEVVERPASGTLRKGARCLVEGAVEAPVADVACEDSTFLAGGTVNGDVPAKFRRALVLA